MPQLLQAGAIPFRWVDDAPEVLLVTSKGGNWIFPKGIVESGETPEETAAKECREEAGVLGHLLSPSVGSYDTRKWKHDCTVELYLLRWEADDDVWEEASIRERAWFAVHEARERIKPELVPSLDAAHERLLGDALAIR